MDKPQRILIVDDDEQNRELLFALVESAGLEPELASNGAEALSKVRNGVDLVLLDVMMPGMDGFEVVRRIRQMPETADLPVVMVTVLDGKDYRLRAVEAGANDFISKPVDRTELFIRTNALLRMKEVQDAVKQHRKELERNAAELARSNRELEDFASVVSHDLQAPARQIALFCDMLLDEHANGLPETAAELVQRIQKASMQMRTLIRDLLEVSRVRTHVQTLGQVDLKRVAIEVMESLRADVDESHGRVEFGDLALLDADATQMRQLMQNLIQNALKFRRPEAPPVVKVYCHYVRGGNESPGKIGGEDLCQLIVEDNGIGFDQNQSERIFGVFQRLHNRDEYDGTGIGLAVCQRIAERHGGSITTRSVPGEGSTFIVTLPIRQREEGIHR